MLPVEDELQHYIQSAPGSIDILGSIHTDGRARVAFRSGNAQPYLAAGLAQLSVALYVCEQVDHQNLFWHTMLTLKGEHVRPGTGLLQAFAPGTQLSLLQAFGLAVQESDNTALNVILEHIGGQTAVNQWFAQDSILRHSGLTRRDDCLYESGEMSPVDAYLLLVAVRSRGYRYLTYAMARNHFSTGLQAVEGPASYWQRNRYRRYMLAARLAARFDSEHKTSRELINGALNRRLRQRVINKEGILPLTGTTYRHDIGITNSSDGRSQALTVIMTQDAAPQSISDLAGIVDRSLRMVRPIRV